MIMLPLHGQNTTGPQFKVSGQAILRKLTRKDVFIKQADMKIIHIYIYIYVCIYIYMYIYIDDVFE